LESAIIREQFTGFKTTSDNYISLLPGESRTETATFNAGTLPAGSKVQVDGFNITVN
jgi:hypothetical protein